VKGEAGLSVGAVDDTNVASFDAFYRASYLSIARLATVLSGDAADADDLAQEAFLRTQPRFDGLDSPIAYTRTVLVNLCRERHRRESRWRARMPKLVALESTPDDTVELLDALSKLPYRQRAVLVLRYFADLTELEIAAELQCKPGTVKSLAARALQRLRKELGE
jgi:RNA polymerase sigma-70 factor (sigma-E family)